METLDNIMHANFTHVRGETLRGIFDKSEIFSCFQMKFSFLTSSNMYQKYMRKIFDQCFYFLLQRKLGKSAFFEGSG